MNVEPSVQARLLELAKVDGELTRIAHRRKSLPEQTEVARLEQQRTAHKDAAVAVEIVLGDLDRDSTKLESEIDAVRNREERDRGLLQAGSVGAKQLTELEHELTTLARRQSVLEDELLEVMERREASASDYQHAGAQLSKTEEDLATAQRQLAEVLADLDVAENRCSTDRSALVGQFPDELLAAYERQRTQTGIGAALLQARRCGACRLELDRGEIARITKTPADVVLRCPECNAILVRTKESGL